VYVRSKGLAGGPWNKLAGGAARCLFTTVAGGFCKSPPKSHSVEASGGSPPPHPEGRTGTLRLDFFGLQPISFGSRPVQSWEGFPEPHNEKVYRASLLLRPVTVEDCIPWPGVEIFTADRYSAERLKIADRGQNSVIMQLPAELEEPLSLAHRQETVAFDAETPCRDRRLSD